MRPLPLLCLAVLLGGCGSSPKPTPPVSTTQAGKPLEIPVESAEKKTGHHSAPDPVQELVKSAGLDSRIKRRIASWDREIEEGLQEQARIRSRGKEAMDTRISELSTKKTAGRSSVVDLYLLGRMLGKLGRIEEARAAFQDSLERDPDFLFGYEGLALCTQQKAGTPDFKKTRALLDRAFSIWHDFPRGYLALGRVLLREKPGNAPDALTAFQKIPQHHPAHDEALVGICECHRQMHQGDLAILKLKRGLEKKPDNTAWRICLGTALLEAGKLDEAETSLTRVLKANPDNPLALFRMAQVDARKGRVEEARARFEKVAWNPAYPKTFRQEAVRERNRLVSGSRRQVTGAELLEILQNSPDAAERREAASVLVNVARKPVIQVFSTKLSVDKEPDEGVRVYAVKAMARAILPSDLPRFLKGLLDPKCEPSRLVRGAAARALGRVPAKLAPFEDLIRALDDPDGYVFRQARSSLRRISGERMHQDFGGTLSREKKAEVIAGWRRWFEERSARTEGRKG